jgi:hypothetical protein
MIKTKFEQIELYLIYNFCIDNIFTLICMINAGLCICHVPICLSCDMRIYIAEDLNLVPIVTGGFRTFCY